MATTASATIRVGPCDATRIHNCHVTQLDTEYEAGQGALDASIAGATARLDRFSHELTVATQVALNASSKRSVTALNDYAAQLIDTIESDPKLTKAVGEAVRLEIKESLKNQILASLRITLRASSKQE